MKVGILTFHDGINYGAFFQVYSMQTFLLRYGFDCQVINYKSVDFTMREYKVFLKLRRPLYSMRNICKIAKFKRAHKRLLLTKRLFTQKQLSKLSFDRIVIGSDEVWNFGSKLIGYDPVYFSQGLKADRIISYAASFGSIETYEDVPQELRNLLKRLEYISVRDSNSKNIMSAIIQKPVHTVLDPTFLVNLKQQAIIPDEHGFILVYGAFSKPVIDKISEFARFVGKKTISVGYRLPWCDISIDTLSPFQWLGYFVNCDCVITTMFHGMIYAILNRKQFSMFNTSYRKNKLGNLLFELGLADRLLNEQGSVKNVFASETDYQKVNGKVEKKRHQSEKFLLEALQF